MSEPAVVANGASAATVRRMRRSGVLLILGLLVEGATLFALDRPVGFLTFATAGGVLVLAGIALYCWAIVSHQ